jgi:hypothetical protein
MFLLHGNPLPIDLPFTVDDISYPANWLRLTSIEEKNAIGITEVPDVSITYDDRFYWDVNLPKELEDLKTNWTSQIKETANSLLSSSDWMIIRKVERSIDVPASVTTYRAAVIAECSRLVNAIAACIDVPTFITIVTTQGWPINE